MPPWDRCVLFSLLRWPQTEWVLETEKCLCDLSRWGEATLVQLDLAGRGPKQWLEELEEGTAEALILCCHEPPHPHWLYGLWQ